MISPTDREYELTRQIKKGFSQLEFPFDSIANWIQNRFNARPINIIYDTLPEDNRPRLQVVLDKVSDLDIFADRNGLYPNKTKESKILRKFKN